MTAIVPSRGNNGEIGVGQIQSAVDNKLPEASPIRLR